MALALEGGANAGSSFNASPTINITTSGTNRWIVVNVAANRATTEVNVTSVTATGLTFAKYFHYLNIAEGAARSAIIEVWYAFAATQQTGKTITVNFDLAPSDCILSVAAVSGSSITTGNPFDPNASLPVLFYSGDARVPPDPTTVPIIKNMVTTSTNSMLFFLASGNDIQVQMGDPTGGWTTIGYLTEGASASCMSQWWYLVVSSPQNLAKVTTTSGIMNRFGAAGFALMADPLATAFMVPAQTAILRRSIRSVAY